MKLKELAKKFEQENRELEVWDANVDISCPIYLYGEHCYEDNEEDHNFYLMENWMNELEVSNCFRDSCCVDVYSEIEKNWKSIIEKAKEVYRLEDNEEDIAAFTEDVFTCLSQGYYNFAKYFVKLMNL